MEKQLLSVMLNSRDAYTLIKQHITSKTYSKEFQIILGYIDDYYARDSKADKIEQSLLTELISGSVPNEKHAERFNDIVAEAYLTDTSSANVKQVVLQAKQKELGNELAMAIANGKEHDDILDKYRELRGYQDLDEMLDTGVEVYDASSLDDLIAHEVDPSTRLKVYPLALNDKLEGGLRGSDHVVIYAPPETGKTGLVLTVANGFARQDAFGIVFQNEERIDRLRMRALSCATGMTAAEIRANPQAAKDIAEQMGYHNILFVSMSPGTLSQIDAFVERYKPKWFIVDQIRHLAMKSENRTNQLEAAAVGVRNIAKKHNAIAISVTQAADSATNKAVLDMGDVDNSNVGIPGACDVLLGIGGTEEQRNQGIRVLSLAKNKISGDHSPVLARINPYLSKYISYKDQA